MIFWILASIGAIAIIVTFFVNLFDRWGGLFDALLGAVLAAIFSVIGIGVALFLTGIVLNPAETNVQTGTDHHQLRAVGTGSGIKGQFSGSFFVSSGYVNSNRVLNYIAQDGAAIHVESVDASKATLFEDGSTSLTVTHWEKDTPWWFVPWNWGTSDTYEFHIPAGSVQGDYQVVNK